jgi:hypothetical protein
MITFNDRPMGIDDICGDCGLIIVAHSTRMVGEVKEYINHEYKRRRKVLCKPCAFDYFITNAVASVNGYGQEEERIGKTQEETTPAGLGEGDDTGVYMPKDGEWNPAEIVAEASKSTMRPAHNHHRTPYF